jgi:hypothetical protein
MLGRRQPAGSEPQRTWTGLPNSDQRVPGRRRLGSGGGTRTPNMSVNGRPFCQLNYPGRSMEDSSARTSPMIDRCTSTLL